MTLLDNQPFCHIDLDIKRIYKYELGIDWDQFVSYNLTSETLSFQMKCINREAESR